MKSLTTINWTYFIAQCSIYLFRPERRRNRPNRMLFRFPAAPSVRGWGALALALLVPGSFVVLPLLWLAGELKESVMMKRASSPIAAPAAKPESVIGRLRRWCQSPDASERYLAEATSLAELERRLRVLERGSGGLAFVTFNH
jgi:hypothetical protein